MAYFVGQKRRQGGNAENYMININNDIMSSTYSSPNPFGGDTSFTDLALKIKESGEVKNLFFSFDQVYYLRFKILKIPHYFYSCDNTRQQYIENYENADQLVFTVQLSDEGDNIQTIGTGTVPVAKLFPQPMFKSTQNNQSNDKYDYIASQYFDQFHQSPYTSFTFVFSPDKDANFNTIVFKIQRNSYDAIENPMRPKGKGPSFTDGRTWLLDYQDFKDQQEGFVVHYGKDSSKDYKMLIDLPTIVFDYSNETNPAEGGQISQLINLFQEEGSIPKKKLKIGYQGRPGSLIVVNKEPIRVGRSGIYELDCGLPIDDFRIAAPGGAKDVTRLDAFLLDYAYTVL